MNNLEFIFIWSWTYWYHNCTNKIWR